MQWPIWLIWLTYWDLLTLTQKHTLLIWLIYVAFFHPLFAQNSRPLQLDLSDLLVIRVRYLGATAANLVVEQNDRAFMRSLFVVRGSSIALDNIIEASVRLARDMSLQTRWEKFSLVDLVELFDWACGLRATITSA